MTWLLVGVGLLAGYWLLWRPAKPTLYRGRRQADLPRFFQSLFMFLADGGVIHVRHEGSPRQLRFRKVRLATGQLGLRLEIPADAGMLSYGPSVREALTAAGFSCSEPPPLYHTWPAQHPVQFAADQLTTIDAFRAAEVARTAMDLGQDARYTMHLEGVPSVAATREYVAARS